MPNEGNGVIGVTALAPSKRKAYYSDYGVERGRPVGAGRRQPRRQRRRHANPAEHGARRRTRWRSLQRGQPRRRARATRRPRRWSRSATTAATARTTATCRARRWPSPHAAGVAALAVAAAGRRERQRRASAWTPRATERVAAERTATDTAVPGAAHVPYGYPDAAATASTPAPRARATPSATGSTATASSTPSASPSLGGARQRQRLAAPGLRRRPLRAAARPAFTGRSPAVTREVTKALLRRRDPGHHEPGRHALPLDRLGGRQAGRAARARPARVRHAAGGGLRARQAARDGLRHDHRPRHDRRRARDRRPPRRVRLRGADGVVPRRAAAGARALLRDHAGRPRVAPGAPRRRRGRRRLPARARDRMRARAPVLRRRARR